RHQRLRRRSHHDVDDDGRQPQRADEAIHRFSAASCGWLGGHRGDGAGRRRDADLSLIRIALNKLCFVRHRGNKIRWEFVAMHNRRDCVRRVQEGSMRTTGSDVFDLFSETYASNAREEMSLQEYLLACREDRSLYATAP